MACSNCDFNKTTHCDVGSYYANLGQTVLCMSGELWKEKGECNMDIHWGTYGKLKSDYHPYRTDIGNNDTNFLTVGKLDRNSVEWAKGKTHFERFKDWYVLSRAQKWNALQEQFRVEKNIAGERIRSWMMRNGDYNLVVEIANEPNLYPYIPPAMYAAYYTLWYKFIKYIDSRIKVMNGGYWIFDGLPKAVRLSMPTLGITLTSLKEYHSTFLLCLDEELWPDIINLHYYPYDYRSIKINHLIKMFHGRDIWITEWGNINAISENETCNLIKAVVKKFKTIPEIKSAYYFRSESVDSKLIEAQAQIKKWKSKRIVRWFLSISNKKWLRWTVKLVPKFGGVINPLNMLEIIKLFGDYERQLPYQGLENGRFLNSLGRAYFRVIKGG